MKSPDGSTVYKIFEGLVNVTPEVTVFEDINEDNDEGDGNNEDNDEGNENGN